ncbi:uncharacterized protein LOC131291215 [Anopheles ziemanni]|uniref:uncharacterized protein LOC131269380 n=1 Tax=Anopheles coustani TaxID=139045 RepID=UPI00265924DB|nr:uncharacterized protein LOC131269380 [Anopheles coustani]XP_058176387.1 uncharacterized protein LOC131291215 [Anopheles ziemanni]
MEYLGVWFDTKNVWRTHVNYLLQKCSKRINFLIPRDSRTFLQTPTQVSVDGLPLFKSSATQFWPVLIKVEELPDAPVMPVAIFCGQTKPESVEQYLRPFVQEMNILMERGLKFGDKEVHLSISAFIADSPARSYIKSVMGFSAKHGCTKCTILGVHIKPENKVIFDSVHAELRTDAGFRAREDKDHHKGIRTPLEDLQNVDMIVNFPVSDRLHLIDLGVSRKILKGLLNNTFERFVICLIVWN